MLKRSKLRGFKTGKHAGRLIATLFADNTMVYLSKLDRFKDLKKILNKWCKVSGVKFNIPKIVIVLVGTKEHRDALVMTRWTQRHRSRISGDIKIVQDGEATRLLGTFIGNGIEDSSIWTPTLEIGARDLKR
ncbi:hypothetical protein J132_01469 [Termitomyces sp. J132]|nr:hypothetical protein J132_01469 [Termitomyces sp. J132]